MSRAPRFPPAFRPREESVNCGLCGRALGGFSPRLNDVRVCGSCYADYFTRRHVAFALDWFVLFLVPWAALMWLAGFSGTGPVFMGVDSPLMIFLIARIPLVIRDAVFHRSPGKALTGLGVIDRISGEGCNFTQSVKRNFVLAIPVLGVPYAWLTLFSGRRIGDRYAGTLVVWQSRRHMPPFEYYSTACRGCGYDLTGNMSGICPECGIALDHQMRRRVGLPQQDHATG